MPIPDRIKSDPAIPNVAATRVETRGQIGTAIPDATDAEIDAALATISQDVLWDAEAPNWTHEVWDRRSAINGVPAADVLARRTDIPATGDVVLVKDASGRVIMFQPHEPGVEGIVRIPPGQGGARGLELVERIVADRVSNETARRVIEHIQASRGA